MYSRVSAQYEWIQSNVCAFSNYPPDWFNCEAAAPVPTPAPTPALSPGQIKLLIVIELDDNPSETGWRLSNLSERDGDEDIIFEMPVGSYANSDVGLTFQYEAIVDDEGFYNMTIYESMGNGFGGTLVVSDLRSSDLPVLMNEPGFTAISGTVVSHGFYVGSAPPQYLTLNFVFDVFPNELAFDISNDDDGMIFALAWFGTFDSSYTSATVTIPIYTPSSGDQGYTLKMWDANEDGICCKWGDGRYDLYLGDPDAGGTFLGGSRGNYGAEGTFPFVIRGESSLILSTTTSPPSSLVTTRSSNKPTLRPTALAITSEDPRVPTMSYENASIPSNESPPTSISSDAFFPIKDDDATSSNGVNGATKNESESTIVTSAASDTSAAMISTRIFLLNAVIAVASLILYWSQ